jgi:ABC-2 type transport system ATP-binding protein
MQRRLELASTLIHRPDLIFVDEPTAGIDPLLRAKFWEHFKSLRDEGRTLFVTTQYVTEADYCDVVAILNRGQLLALGTPEEIRRHAMGGEVLDLKLSEITSQALRLLRELPTLRRLRIMSTEELRLIVANAADTLKEIIALFEQHQIEIQSIQPYRPDFEEVFVQLMEQDIQENGTVSQDAPKDKPKNVKAVRNTSESKKLAESAQSPTIAPASAANVPPTTTEPASLDRATSTHDNITSPPTASY